jgi:hypothetical protein
MEQPIIGKRLLRGQRTNREIGLRIGMICFDAQWACMTRIANADLRITKVEMRG